MPRPVDVDALAEGVVSGSRGHLARAITLVESTHPDHRTAARELLRRLTPTVGDSAYPQPDPTTHDRETTHDPEPASASASASEPASDSEPVDGPPTTAAPSTVTSVRLGISGVPGAGKSTFINALGLRLIEEGHRVAVLAVDPSSARSGGSILGDRTRMGELTTSPDAFVRPSPTGLHLGGVARATRESMIVVEAAGFDVVIVETVGVGQSEVAVAEMVDTFLLLALARAGDQLQGIKRGILEIADVIAVNKADGPHEAEARGTARELAIAMRLLRGGDGERRVPVLTCSALHGDGLDEVWREVLAHRSHLELSVEGGLARRRGEQQLQWLWALLQTELWSTFRGSPAVREAAAGVEREIREQRLSAVEGAGRILEAFAQEAPQLPWAR
ncbi:methylmalonyl Co-A mutase-associated GTPase MeaB [Serinicoccus profundi]|uniref:methylmalonyl Co-A mutase-associated GTPase MeaB n=1 Tax=Serinicoccus profundi TaxID=1078471 RepID=UPI000313F227|nr:methylmalonyl Co-A mutase-associated GTPase MeaB [Serinicoccus profundi]